MIYRPEDRPPRAVTVIEARALEDDLSYEGDGTVFPDAWGYEWDRQHARRFAAWAASPFYAAAEALFTRAKGSSAPVKPEARTEPVLPAEMHLLAQQPLPAD